MWERPVDFTLLARDLTQKVNPNCCHRCGVVDLIQQARRCAFTAGVAEPKLRVLEFKTEGDLYNFLQLKVADLAKKQAQSADAEIPEAENQKMSE